MTTKNILIGLSLCFLFSTIVVNSTAKEILPPIQELADIKAKDQIWKVTKRGVPITLRNKSEAAKYFAEPQLKLLLKKVDFQEQVLLVFAWRGSGQDKMTYTVAESFPEQITFKILPGRTRDLRPHLKIYALRKNVKFK
ncbi:MAG: hypothetical protein VX738_05815 [Planctomycetota bacterium]|nr:hypothetical protein [Planctomycetota bacterium]